MNVKVYAGVRDTESGTCRVLVDDGSTRKTLNPRLDLWAHSPTGLEWGYGGSGPAQLALALLADALGNDRLAVEYHQDVKRLLVCGLDHEGWIITEKQLHDAVMNAMEERDANG